MRPNGETRMSFLLALTFFLLPMVFSVSAQLRSPQKLSAEDNRELHKELERLQRLLSTANDKGAIELQIANTYAAGGQYQEAIRRLSKVVDADLGFDPSRDRDFANLRNTVEFQPIMEEVRRQTPAVLHSRLVATIDANPQIDKKDSANLRPLQVLAVRVGP